MRTTGYYGRDIHKLEVPRPKCLFVYCLMYSRSECRSRVARIPCFFVKGVRKLNVYSQNSFPMDGTPESNVVRTSFFCLDVQKLDDFPPNCLFI